MNILEKEIEQIVSETIKKDPEALMDRGLYVGRLQRYIQQLDLGDYGRADIVGISFYNEPCEIYLEVIELKKDRVDSHTLMQAVRYVRCLQLLFREIAPEYTITSTEIILIGKTIETNGDFCYTPNVFSNVSLYTYSIDLLQGIKFTRQYGYVLTGANFGTSKNVLKSFLNNIVENDQETASDELAKDLPF
jgi:hypothetical protein